MLTFKMPPASCICILSAVFALTLIARANSYVPRKLNSFVSNMQVLPTTNKETWDYVTVRPKAHMFYWLYYTTHASGYQDRPLIMWLQGGPGGSGTGFGNFKELGPLDTDLKPRNSTWLQTASLLFVDNPVGTGYSYVEDDSAFATTNDEIAEDMLTLLKGFIKSHPEFKTVPFYIFCESYGGKMTAGISAHLYQAVQKGDINMNFKGLALGDSFISPADSILSWGPYLYVTSLVSESGLETISSEAKKIVEMINTGQFDNATDGFFDLEHIVANEVSPYINWYNIMNWNQQGIQNSKNKAHRDGKTSDESFQRYIQPFATADLDKLMNGPIRRKLGIIPKNFEWGEQRVKVFANLKTDFMKNVTNVVNDLINNTPLKVVVYSGQFDLICDILGTEAWFYRLDVAEKFKGSEKKSYTCNTSSPVCYFAKKYKNVEFYWILNAGHMVPADNGPGALSMVNQIIGN